MLYEVIVGYQAEPVLPGETLEVSFMNESWYQVCLHGPFSHHKSIRGNFYCFFFGCVSTGGEMVSGLNEDVCHEPVVSSSKTQPSVVS